ncbi:hypothetical protein BIW12_00370 [Flavobacterium commune]|uniref:Uncharacterized protein n=1 Tax=Flavobacterium commune TaxID=1306519 RepID=A0A1D9P6S3_9FLAO|nr:hypothetical protein BIW12_00370 [Flavobacterium commune]
MNVTIVVSRAETADMELIQSVAVKFVSVVIQSIKKCYHNSFICVIKKNRKPPVFRQIGVIVVVFSFKYIKISLQNTF